MKQNQKITLAARVDDDALWALYFSLLYIITIRVASKINYTCVFFFQNET